MFSLILPEHPHFQQLNTGKTEINRTVTLLFSVLLESKSEAPNLVFQVMFLTFRKSTQDG